MVSYEERDLQRSTGWGLEPETKYKCLDAFKSVAYLKKKKRRREIKEQNESLEGVQNIIVKRGKTPFILGYRSCRNLIR